MLKSLGGDDGVSDEEDSGNLDFNGWRKRLPAPFHVSLVLQIIAAVGVAQLRPCANFLLQCWV